MVAPLCSAQQLADESVDHSAQWYQETGRMHTPILLTATGLQGIRGFVQICRAARKLTDYGIVQIICLHDHGLLPGKEHEIGKEYVLTRTAQMFGFTAMIGHADDGAMEAQAWS